MEGLGAKGQGSKPRFGAKVRSHISRRILSILKSERIMHASPRKLRTLRYG